MIAPLIKGFATGGGLIVAIGAQNAYVLSQGVRRNFHWTVASICIVCDVLLITAGVAGFGSVLTTRPGLSELAAWAGAGFLFLYGLRSLRSALCGGSLDTSDHMVPTLRAAIFTTLAVTLLNPHVYLDTIFLMGSVSGQLHGESRLYFWMGAVAASIVWFLSLSLGGQMLAPLFKKQISWRILDGMVCATMWAIAVTLIRH